MDIFGIVIIVLAVSLFGWIPISSFLDGIANIVLAFKGIDANKKIQIKQ